MTEDDPEDEGVLDPEDLDVRNDERVVELGENRFFVSLSEEPAGVQSEPDPSRPADGTDPALGSMADDPLPDDQSRTRTGDESPPSVGSTAPQSEPANPPRTGESALRDALDGVDGTYAIAAAVRTDRGEAAHVIGTNNVAETFETFCRWYAAQVGDGRTTPEEVLRILVRESDLEL